MYSPANARWVITPPSGVHLCKKVRSRLESEGAGSSGGHIQFDLMGHGGCDGYHCMRTRSECRSMHMPAHDPLHLPVLSDDGSEPLRVAQADPVHMLDSRGERRMMHGDDGRTLRSLGERILKEA